MPVESFKTDRSRIRREFFDQIEQVEKKGEWEAKNFYQQDIKEYGTKDAFTDLIEKSSGTDILKAQLVGNCAWESLEAAMWVLFSFHYTQEDNPLKGTVLFDDWLQSMEVDVVNQYLTWHQNNPREFDKNLIQKIFDKADSHLGERDDFFSKTAPASITKKHRQHIKSLQQKHTPPPQTGWSFNLF